MHPPSQSGRLKRDFTTSARMSSETSCPAACTFRTSKPKGSSLWAISRRMSPVATRGSLSLSASRCACVPLPAPCGPIKTVMSGIAALVTATPTKTAAPRTEETIIMAHDKLRFDLIHRIHRNADYDQQTGSPEKEVHPYSSCQPRGQWIRTKQVINRRPDEREVLKLK